MRTIDNMAGDSLAAHQQYLSDKDKARFKKEILSLSAALVCLATGFIYSKLYPTQDVIVGFIYVLGILIIGIPVFCTAINGFIKKDAGASMEILVSIAMIIASLDNQFTLAILIPVILTFVHFLEEKSIIGGKDAIEGLKKLQSTTALLVRNGATTEVDANQLEKGDIITVKPGMSLPIDGIIVEGNSSMDQKSLTGEALPKEVSAGDKVFAGTTNIDGSLLVRVEKEYLDTSFRKIVNLLEGAEHISLPEAKIIDTFMMYYIPLTLVIATLIWLFSGDISKAIAVLVVSCPCGHMLVNSAPMVAALSRAAKMGVAIKNSAFLEKLSEIDYVIFDKTGTITNGTLIASNYYLKDAKSFEELICEAASIAHHSLHPVSQSIINLCGDIEYSKDYSIKEHIGKGVEGTFGGNTILLGNYRWISSLGYDISCEYEGDGASSWIIKNGVVLGCIIFKDTPRADAREVILKLKEMGIRETCLLTGDNLLSAKRIKEAVQIDTMHCQLLPEQKLDKVKDAMQHHNVCVIGDGINDALALAHAHIGIAMGAMGSDTAIQSADIALMNNNLKNIPLIIELSRKTKNIIYQNIILAFTISFIMIFLAGLGVVTPLVGAFLHNIGAFIVLINSGRILKESD